MSTTQEYQFPRRYFSIYSLKTFEKILELLLKLECLILNNPHTRVISALIVEVQCFID